MPYVYYVYAKTIISEIPLPLVGEEISVQTGASVPGVPLPLVGEEISAQTGASVPGVTNSMGTSDACSWQLLRNCISGKQKISKHQQDVVTLKRGEISADIDYTHTLEETGIRYAVANDHITIEVKGASVFKIIQPDQVIFDPYNHPHRTPESTEKIIGSCFLHLILQFLISGSTQFLFHGSAVTLPGTEVRRQPELIPQECSRDGGALILIGEKGAGKSTIAAALALSGCSLLCDDIVPIVGAEGVDPAVLPGIARAKLLPDAYQKLFSGNEPEEHLFDGISKYYTDVSQVENTRPHTQKLAAIIYLEQEPGASITITPLKGSKKFQKMIKQVIRIDGLDSAAVLFETVTGSCRNTPLYLVTLPNHADPWVVSTRILEFITSRLNTSKERLC